MWIRIRIFIWCRSPEMPEPDYPVFKRCTFLTYRKFIGLTWYGKVRFLSCKVIPRETVSWFAVRNSVAYSLAAIAHWDWPDHWPQLFDILMQVWWLPVLWIRISYLVGFETFSRIRIRNEFEVKRLWKTYKIWQFLHKNIKSHSYAGMTTSFVDADFVSGRIRNF